MITSSLMNEFIKAAVQKLKGDWVVIGGALLPLLNINHRVTVDIDIVPIEKTDQQLELMRIAEKIGVPVEAINPAATFYLKEIKGFNKELILFHEGKNARIFRPSLNLYMQLKLKRLTVSDAEDLMHYIKYCKKNGDPLDVLELKRLVVNAKKAHSSDASHRLLDQMAEKIERS